MATLESMLAQGSFNGVAEDRITKALKPMKAMLDIPETDTSKDIPLAYSYYLQHLAVQAYIDTVEVPLYLDYIVINSGLARYQQRGSEGYESESVDIITRKYSKDLLEPYKTTLDNYIKAHTDHSTNPSGYWKFL